MRKAPTVAQNAIMPMAKKVEDNVLLAMTALIIALQLAAPQNLVANPPCTLLRAANTLIIK